MPFDPYVTWLGITADAEPLDYYHLLGLERFESDRRVIAAASAERIARVRSYQRGPHAGHARKLVAELSKATSCLLNARRKRLYDLHLRSAAQARKEGEAAWPPASAAAAQPPRRRGAPLPPALPTIVPFKREKQSWRHSRRAVAAVFAVAAVMFVAVCAVLVAISDSPQGPQPRPATPAAAELPPAGAQPPGAATPATIPTGLPASSVAESPAADAGAQDSWEPAAAAASDRPPAVATPAPPPEEPLPFASDDPRAKALRFGGTDRIELPGASNLVDLRQPFTVELWVRFAEGSYAHWLIGDLVFGDNHPDVAPGATAGWQLWIMQTESDKQRVAVATGKGFWADAPAAGDNWRHLAVCGDGGEIAIFVDGRRAASRPLSVLLESYRPSPIPLHVGSHGFLHPHQPLGFQGDLRDVRVSSVCRYRENFTPPDAFAADADTQVLLDFTHVVSSGRIDDLAAPARPGTVRGARWFARELSDSPTADSPAAAAPADATVSSEPSPPSAATTAAKSPLPPHADQAAARRRIEEIFAEELAAARQPGQHSALAEKLLALAGETRDDPTAQFVLLSLALELAGDNGDLPAALRAVAELQARFEIDELAWQAQAMLRVGQAAGTPGQSQQLAEAVLSAMRQMMRGGRFELAADLASTAVAAATRARNAELGKQARRVRDEVHRAKRLSQEAEKARLQLETDPHHAHAHLLYGKFLCFQRNQWEQGAAHLARGDVAALKGAALAQLAATGGAEALAAAAEAWHQALPAVDKNDREAVLAHVLQLSRSAADQLKGLDKVREEKRIEEIEAELAAAAPGVAGRAPTPDAALPQVTPPEEFRSLLGRLQIDGRDTGVLWKYQSGLRLTDRSVGDMLMQLGLPRGKARMEFVGLISLAESATVHVTHGGGTRGDATAVLLIDGRQVGSVGGDNPTTDVYKLELPAGQHTVGWVLEGKELGVNSLQVTDAQGGPLHLYHTPQLLATAREMPSRARITVNMLPN